MPKIDSRSYEIYKSILEGYLLTESEHALYEAQQLSRQLTKENISPDEMVNMHLTIANELIPEMPKKVFDANALLVEVMVSYGMAYREHQILRDRQKQLNIELAVAAKIQQELLPKDVPQIPSLDIGIKSVPANIVNGDYHHFFSHLDGFLGIAVADIIGKGISAALCMSMIKYAMDTLPEEHIQPSSLLEKVNKVVEQNISSNMFITMVYGSYDLTTHTFHYSGAGHEPGFFYHGQTKQWQDLATKGIVLGLTKKATYKEYECNVSVGDLIVLLSDGVTECRTENGFLERIEIRKLIEKYIHLPSQTIVESVYQELEKIQNFQLKDDFTLMVLKRVV